MVRWLSPYVLGPALAAARFYQAQSEVKRVRNVDDALEYKHLQNLRAFQNRKEMITSFPKDAFVAEVGVAAGDFSSIILRETMPKKLYLIDIWLKGEHASGLGLKLHRKRAKNSKKTDDLDVVRTKFAEEIESGRVEICHGSSLPMLDQLADRSLDWVYLDARHDFRSVRADLEAILPKLRSSGIIAGHDYVRWGRFGYRGGVIEAVHEFCKNHNFELFALSFDSHYPPSYAIRPMMDVRR